MGIEDQEQCRGCGVKGFKSDEFLSPYNGLCNKCQPKEEKEEIKTYDKVASRQSNLGFHLIGWEAIKQIGDICLKGDEVYKDKSINGKFIKNLLEMDPGKLEEWVEERGYNHALVHLLKGLQGCTKENHFAKCAWFCMVMIEMDHYVKNEKIKVPWGPKNG
jgi:hypothetical protein